MSEPVFMAQIRAADIPESMPVSRAISRVLSAGMNGAASPSGDD